MIDYWGYYNGKDNSHGIPACRYTGAGLPEFLLREEYLNIDENKPYQRAGADRGPNAAKMKACILTQITFPTGGWTRYEYGCHKYWNPVTRADEDWGGLRIERVTTSDGLNSSNDMITEYYYTEESNAARSSGTVDDSFLSKVTGKYSTDLYNRPMIVTDRTKTSFSTAFTKLNPFIANLIEELSAQITAGYYLIRSSQAANISDEIIYSTVTVKQPGKGQVVHSFTSFKEPENRDISPEVYRMFKKERLDQNFNSSKEKFLLDYMTKASRRWRRGLTTDVRSYTEGGRIRSWRHTDYGFKTETDESKHLPGLVFYSEEIINRNANYGFPAFSYFGKYTEVPEWVFVTKVTDRHYNQDSETEFIESSTGYSYNAANLQVAEVIAADGNGKKIIKRFKYPSDYPDIPEDPNPDDIYKTLGIKDRKAAVNEMLRRNMTSVVLETQTWQQTGGGEEQLLSATLNEFDYVSKPEGYPWYQFTYVLSPGTGAVGSQLKYNLIVPKRTLKLLLLTPLSVAPADPSNYRFSTLTSTGAFSYDASRFTAESIFDSYDTRGNALEVQALNSPPACTVLGNNGTFIIARVMNARHKSVAFTSFEAYGDKGNWNYSAGQAGDARTGSQSFSGGEVSSESDLPAGKYKVSFWYKGNGITVNGNAIPGSTDWKYGEQLLDNPGKVTVRTGTARLDELRLHPAEAVMTTYTYKEQVGPLTEADQNGMIVSYEYDGENRLRLVRDQYGNILKKVEYHYQGQ